MGRQTKKTEAGQGGKLGHSNQNHWAHTTVVKAESRAARRIESRRLERRARQGLIED